MDGLAQNWTRDGVTKLSLWHKGYPAYLGSFVEQPAGVYTVGAAGADIWKTNDEFHFAYKEVASGACSIIAKVESLDPINKDSKAGIMIRDSLDPGATNAALLLTPDTTKGLRFQFRKTTNGVSERGTTADPNANLDPNAMAPYWLRLERTSGGMVKAYRSPNGSQWTQFPILTVTMTMPIYIGLAVTSHDAKQVCEAKFSNVSFPTGTALATQAWKDTDIGLISNDAEPMYVALTSDSKTAFVYHDDPNAVNIESWTEWPIPLQRFADQGINLSNVKSFGIGFGDRNNLQSGGVGTMFFDDIRLYRPAP